MGGWRGGGVLKQENELTLPVLLPLKLQDNVEVRVARIFNTYGPRMHMYDGTSTFASNLDLSKAYRLAVSHDGWTNHFTCTNRRSLSFLQVEWLVTLSFSH